MVCYSQGFFRRSGPSAVTNARHEPRAPARRLHALVRRQPYRLADEVASFPFRLRATYQWHQTCFDDALGLVHHLANNVTSRLDVLAQPGALAGSQAHFFKVPSGVRRWEDCRELRHGVLLREQDRPTDMGLLLRWRRRLIVSPLPLAHDAIPEDFHRLVWPLWPED